MTTDFRALSAQLLAWAERTSAHYVVPPHVILRARAALAAPEQGPTDEELIELANNHGVSMQDIGILTSTVLARWGRPAVEPVPVAERLPGPEDLDDQGRCWWLDRWQRHNGEIATVWLFRRPDDWAPIPRPIDWAPHWALPVPQEGADG